MQARLNLRTRTEAGKGAARKLRRAGRVPGVIYGGGRDTLLVSMEERETLSVLRSISRDDTVLDLTLGAGAVERATVQEVQMHPFRTELLHVDFLRVGAARSGRESA